MKSRVNLLLLIENIPGTATTLSLIARSSPSTFSAGKHLTRPTDYPYSSKQQVGELHALLDALQIDQVVPESHDASGPVAINWSLDYLERVYALILLNAYYGQSPTLRFSEFVSLFADPAYSILSRAMF
jgi:pimeloyl-ACP methyl ester carboxylesterase